MQSREILVPRPYWNVLLIAERSDNFHLATCHPLRPLPLLHFQVPALIFFKTELLSMIFIPQRIGPKLERVV